MSINIVLIILVVLIVIYILNETYKAKEEKGISFIDAFKIVNRETISKVLWVFILALLGVITTRLLNTAEPVPPPEPPTPPISDDSQNGRTSEEPEKPVSGGTGVVTEPPAGPVEDIVYLTEQPQTDINDYIRISDSLYVTDNNENTYVYGSVICCQDDGFSSGEGFVEYRLDGNYKVLNGTLYVPDESKNNSTEYCSMFRIYGDDQLLYDAPAIEGKDKPVEFAVNVEGVELIKLAIEGGWYEGDGNGLIPSICVGNLVLSSSNDSAVQNDSTLPKVYLSELKVDEKESLNESLKGLPCKDNRGNRYHWSGVIANREESGFIEYRLDKNYSELSGTVYIPDIIRTEDLVYPPKVSIYVNDALKKVMTLDEKDAPEKFSVDVSGAESIKIEVGGGWYKGDGSGLIPAICAADLCLR